MAAPSPATGAVSVVVGRQRTSLPSRELFAVVVMKRVRAAVVVVSSIVVESVLFVVVRFIKRCKALFVLLGF